MILIGLYCYLIIKWSNPGPWYFFYMATWIRTSDLRRKLQYYGKIKYIRPGSGLKTCNQSITSEISSWMLIAHFFLWIRILKWYKWLTIIFVDKKSLNWPNISNFKHIYHHSFTYNILYFLESALLRTGHLNEPGLETLVVLKKIQVMTSTELSL